MKRFVADRKRAESDELSAIEKMSKMEQYGTPKLVQHMTSKLIQLRAEISTKETSSEQNSSQSSHEGKDGIGYQRPENPKPSWLKNRLEKDKAKVGSKYFVQHQPWRNSRKAKSGWRKTQPKRDLYGQHMKSKLNISHFNYAQTLKDTYTGKTVKIDSDLVIYRTILVRTFQVVTICRVDKSEVLVVLISPHYSKRH
ncbi:hypothetical protein F511_44416 [Dorcoceras hygrometricum]|uniref:Uncharacterized protein n=1 Tax=Dorcoceras hygrometricum TaxID=472368 RepID=A0A2Z7DBM7_9LAMI|nr:hypothetical protein F511_44416 [Dorcoceras hygrometricum]